MSVVLGILIIVLSGVHVLESYSFLVPSDTKVFSVPFIPFFFIVFIIKGCDLDKFFLHVTLVTPLIKVLPFTTTLLISVSLYSPHFVISYFVVPLYTFFVPALSTSFVILKGVERLPSIFLHCTCIPVLNVSPLYIICDTANEAEHFFLTGSYVCPAIGHTHFPCLKTSPERHPFSFLSPQAPVILLKIFPVPQEGTFTQSFFLTSQ